MGLAMTFNITRRTFLAGMAAGAAFSPRGGRAAAEVPGSGTRTLTLRAAPASVNLVGGGYPATAVWAYGGTVPGPEIRLRQGQRLRVTVENGLEQPTTVHWHGLRIANAMDGVPDLTQPPIPPGGTFTYDLAPPDAGTYWYHPHVRSAEQVGRGLYGALVVEEADPPPVDRDLTWVLDDWRLTDEAAIAQPFGHMMDLSHGGRMGNVATLNGAIPDAIAVRPGERLRLRLINVANARLMALRFTGHRPWVVALDGQPVPPFAPDEGRVLLGPGMRADLIVDMAGAPGSRHQVVDDAYARNAYRVVDLAYGDTPLRDSPLDGPVALPANPLPVPDEGAAERLQVVVAGGAMGGLAQATYDGKTLGIRDLVQQGKVWAINGVVAHRTDMPPLFTLDRGRTYRLVLRNDTAWPHPMHLHGHAFRIVARNGAPAARPHWADTVLLAPEETVEALLVADNPGDWLFHCHILEHHQAGMSSVVRVRA
ncbi:MAG: multicopper oxidase family protein [Hyphomicrobiales bacterium]|nr:multicopper oxidase family protein [Hyphomicrobiales bacterium]MCP5372009.1 multicopper oxidase family protein [Hyphomicrobiales bacterium]